MITIVNYKMGNIRSIVNALEYLGIPSCVTSSPQDILQSEKLILPGVGSYFIAMQNLKSMGLIDPLNEVVLVKKHQVDVRIDQLRDLAFQFEKFFNAHRLGVVELKVGQNMVVKFEVPLRVVDRSVLTAFDDSELAQHRERSAINHHGADLGLVVIGVDPLDRDCAKFSQ